jgi:uncharacterized membrane protein HdeD (DUF308 family)
MVHIGPWWAFVVRGALAIAFGVFLWLIPGMALLTFMFLFGAFALADGVIHLSAAFHRREPDQQHSRGAHVVHGVLSIVAGLIALLVPGLTALALIYVLAGWAVAIGILEIVAAVRLRKLIRSEWVLGLIGAVSILFGILIALAPGAGALAMILWIGAYAVASGIMLVAVGLKIRKWTRTPDEHAPVAPAATASG